MHGEILRPVVVLVAWTLVMLGWAVPLRLSALHRAGVDLGTLIGTTGADADRALPREAQWKVHNYDHLLAQPTLFYAVALVLALSGAVARADAGLAWCYVGLRVAHSMVQATINRVAPRFALFLLSSGVLAILTVRAGLAVFGRGHG